jgi:hypothetical protein
MNIDVKKQKFLNNIPKFYKNVWRINSCVILPFLSIISLTKNIPLMIHSLKNKYLFSNVINLFPHKICFRTLLNVYGEFNWPPPVFIQPKNWIEILKTESSVKSIVNIKKDYFIWFINLSTLSNKLLYNKLVNVKFSKPIGTHYWINYLVLSEKPNTPYNCYQNI